MTPNNKIKAMIGDSLALRKQTDLEFLTVISTATQAAFNINGSAFTRRFLTGSVVTLDFWATNMKTSEAVIMKVGLAVKAHSLCSRFSDSIGIVFQQDGVFYTACAYEFIRRTVTDEQPYLKLIELMRNKTVIATLPDVEAYTIDKDTIDHLYPKPHLFIEAPAAFRILRLNCDFTSNQGERELSVNMIVELRNGNYVAVHVSDIDTWLRGQGHL